jgi:hypothetical protein
MTGTPTRLDQSAITSYRYLRLAIVVVVSSLVASVVIERAHASCWQESISAYYYTPVHAMFVGTLVAIGVCLIAVKGRDGWEDTLLNVAGMLAPVVAFVPTGEPTQSCSSTPFLRPNTNSFIGNNVLAFAIGGVLAIGLAYWIAHRQGKVAVRRPSGTATIGFVISGAFVAAGLTWYWAGRSSFRAHAHSASAISMFTLVGIVVAINSRQARPRYRPLYAAIAVFMLAAGVAVVIVQKTDSHWRHGVLWLEALEITPFALFWAVQTLEHWQAGLATTS